MANKTFLRSNSICAALLWSFALSALAAGVPGQGTWETTLQPRDVSGDNVADAYYDTALDITWLANWNVNGTQHFADAVTWAASLNVYGITGWRLPTTVDDPSSCCFNVPPSSSELAHMFYVTLGNIGGSAGQNNLTNTADFVNIQAGYYWSGTASALYPGNAWFAGMQDGAAGAGTPLYNWYAVAVHNGDIAALVPEPGSYALMLMGLGAVGLVSASRKVR